MPRQLAIRYATATAEQQRLEKLFSELLDGYRDRLAKAGGPLNDVSRAAAYLVSTSYSVAQDAPVLDHAQFAVLRERMSEKFLRDGEFQALSDRDRQKLFEEYGITASWIDSGYNIVKLRRDREGTKQWQEMARQNFQRLMGASPERVVITSAAVEFK